VLPTLNQHSQLTFSAFCGEVRGREATVVAGHKKKTQKKEVAPWC
jgi:hypothetical protein